jgi:pyridoxamine 5'-phosphate oxidase
MKGSSISAQRTKQLASHLLSNMASSSSSSAAPWRATFLSHVEGMDSPTFVLSTLHPIPPLPGSSDERASQFQYTPRARTVVYRGLWASLPDNPKNTAERNPDVYESDLITITTDERMEKVPELFSTASTSAAAPLSRPAGPVEAVFWMPDVMTQWRFRGHAVVIGPDIEGDAGSAARAALTARMRSSSRSKTGEEDDDTHDDATSRRWSWARELTAHFGNLSPVMRGSFRNPPPGTRRDEQPGEGYGLGQKVEDLEDEVARRHFRVVALVPEEVDRVDLSKPDDGRRWNYKYTADQDAWEETELWP